jgi:hypothetical protein
MLFIRMSPTSPSGIHEVCVWVYRVCQVLFTRGRKGKLRVCWLYSSPTLFCLPLSRCRQQSELFYWQCLAAPPMLQSSVFKEFKLFNFVNIIVFMLCFLVLFIPWCKVFNVKVSGTYSNHSVLRGWYHTELYEWTLISTNLYCHIDKESNHIPDLWVHQLGSGFCETNIINVLCHPNS